MIFVSMMKILVKVLFFHSIFLNPHNKRQKNLKFYCSQKTNHILANGNVLELAIVKNKVHFLKEMKLGYIYAILFMFPCDIMVIAYKGIIY